MKKHTAMPRIHAFRKTVLSIGLIGTLLIGMIAPVHAQEKAELPIVRISYAGTINDRPVFRIEFDNSSEDLYNVSIKDGDENVLYSERFKDKRFIRSFLVSDVDLDNISLSFSINRFKDKSTQVFEINKRTRTVQEYTITRL